MFLSLYIFGLNMLKKDHVCANIFKRELLYILKVDFIHLNNHYIKVFKKIYTKESLFKLKQFQT